MISQNSKEKLFRRGVLFLFLATLCLTSNKVYSEYLGFEVLIAWLVMSSIMLFPLSINAYARKGSIFLFILYITAILQSVVYNPKSAPHAIIYCSLLYLFVVAIPSLNTSYYNFLVVLKSINRFIFIVILLFIVANTGLYLSSGFFLPKDKYLNILSNPNTIGYLVYVGFSISFLLYSEKKNKRYLLFVCFYISSLIFIPPVLTAYLSVFSYLLIYQFCNVKLGAKLVMGTIILIIIVWMLNLFINHFDEFRFLLSHRDTLFFESFAKISDQTWIGFGIESWGGLHLEMKNPHNFVLYQLLAFGVIGGGLYLMVVISLGLRAFNKIKQFKGDAFYVHIFSQLIVTILVMSVFVAMPGNYQDISIVLSIVLSLIINAITQIKKPQLS